MSIKTCDQCNQRFEVYEHKLAMPGTKEREEYQCPYCEAEYSGVINGFWVVNALPEDKRSPTPGDDEFES